jgi:hypothetical protein
MSATGSAINTAPRTFEHGTSARSPLERSVTMYTVSPGSREMLYSGNAYSQRSRGVPVVGVHPGHQLKG